jgi:hypothetical protein
MVALLARVARGIRTLDGKEDVGVFRRRDIVWEPDPQGRHRFRDLFAGGFEPETLRDYRRVVQPGFVARS